MIQSSLRPNQVGNHTYKKCNKKTRPLTLPALEESSEDSDSAGETILSSSEYSNKLSFQNPHPHPPPSFRIVNKT